MGWRVRRGKKSRYEVLLRIASGGMGIVYVGRKRGAVGFSRLVAIKRAHPHLHEDPAARRALLGEAAHASRLHHAHVVAVQDVEQIDGELLLIMDYVEGTSLSQLMKRDAKPIPRDAAIRVVLDVCAGLQAAHDLKNDDGTPLNLVHRDVSPQNILVGTDGLARLTDFGIAKSAAAATAGTAEGVLKGKLGYIAPEYIGGADANARSDVYAVGVIAWELLARRRLFEGANEAQTLKSILDGEIASASKVAPEVPAMVDFVLEHALARDPADRYASAQELATALETAARAAGMLGSHAQVAAHVVDVAGERLDERRDRIATAVAGGLDDVASVGPPALRPGSPSDTTTTEDARFATKAAAPQSMRPAAARDRRALVWLGAAAVVAIGALAVSQFARNAGGGAPVATSGTVTQPAASVASATGAGSAVGSGDWSPLPGSAAAPSAAPNGSAAVASRGSVRVPPRPPPSATASASAEKAPPNPYAAASASARPEN